MCVFVQTGEYGTDEEEEMSPMFPNAIEVFELAENEDMLSPVEMDPEKLVHKFKEVGDVQMDTNLPFKSRLVPAVEAVIQV